MNPLKPATLLVALSTSLLLALGPAMPAQASPFAECAPGNPSQIDADVGLAEFTTVCTVEELLEFLESVDCTAPSDLIGQCVFCPPMGGSHAKPAGRTEDGHSVFIAYFPAGFGHGVGRGYHVVYVPTEQGACGADP